MAYPDNSFESDALEVDQYGGADPATFDTKAWTWISGLVRSISKVVLSNVRVSWSNATILVQEAMAIGDVIAFDASRDATDPVTQEVIPYVAKYSTIVGAGGTPKILGVVVAASAALKKCNFANGGLLSQKISGITSIAAGSLVAADATTSKLRLWVAGDDALGYSSPRGSVFLEFMARVSS